MPISRESSAREVGTLSGGWRILERFLQRVGAGQSSTLRGQLRQPRLPHLSRFSKGGHPCCWYSGDFSQPQIRQPNTGARSVVPTFAKPAKVGQPIPVEAARTERRVQPPLLCFKAQGGCSGVPNNVRSYSRRIDRPLPRRISKIPDLPVYLQD
jgi:hypothetical protein